MILNFHTFESCRTPVDWEFLRVMTLPTRFVFRALTVVHGVYMLQNLGLPPTWSWYIMCRSNALPVRIEKYEMRIPPLRSPARSLRSKLPRK